MKHKLKGTISGIMAVLTIAGLSGCKAKNTISGSNEPSCEFSEKITSKARKMIDVHIFYGEECSHSKEAMAFLELYKREFKNINLIKHEVTNNKDNQELMNKVKNHYNDKVWGTPYIVIGDKTFNGFDIDVADQIKETVMECIMNDNYVDEVEQVKDETPSTIKEISKIITTTIEETTKPKTTVKETEKEIQEGTKTTADNQIIYCSDQGFAISEELNNKLSKAINNFSKDDVSFYVEDMMTGTRFSYNENQTYNGGCIVKPSVVLYLLKLAEEGKIDVNTVLKYPGNDVSGSGYLNGYYNGYQAKTGQKFTLFELMYFTLYYSDNNAYKMLYDYLLDLPYYEDYCQHMDEIDAKSLKVNTEKIWVREAKCKDGVNVMLDINNFYESSKKGMNVDMVFVDGKNLKDIAGTDYLTYGEIIYWMMAEGKYDYIEDVTGNFSITKTGFVSGSGNLSCRNLISISYGDRTYAVCLLTKWNDQDARKAVVKKVLACIDEMISEYDLYLENTQKRTLFH